MSWLTPATPKVADSRQCWRPGRRSAGRLLVVPDDFTGYFAAAATAAGALIGLLFD
jgi:hypothetical protein